MYLPEALKAELAALSRRWGRSEAELIREAVERLVRSAQGQATAPAPLPPPRPRSARGPSLTGVGVGPSDPDLVTGRALAVLGDVDRVFAASTAPDAIGRAEAIVRAAAPEVAVDRLVFAIAGDAEERRASLARAADTVVMALDRGEAVAFVTLGDPNVYSTYPAMARLVAAQRPGVAQTTVPGVMAFQDLAARTGTVLAEDGEQVLVHSLGDGLDQLVGALDDPSCTLVIYKGGRRLPELAGHLARAGRLDDAVVGEMLGLPGGRSGPVAAVADRPASYLATVVVPATRAAAAAVRR